MIILLSMHCKVFNFGFFSETDKPKSDVPELECLGFMEDVPGSLRKLINSPSEEIKCVESIVFSSFNPPPSHRRYRAIAFNTSEFTSYVLSHKFICARLVGDLIYLDVVTLEGNKYCITGTTKAFYVNSSSGNVLDPRPSKSGFEATLIGLLQKHSSKFKKGGKQYIRDSLSILYSFYDLVVIIQSVDYLLYFLRL